MPDLDTWCLVAYASPAPWQQCQGASTSGTAVQDLLLSSLSQTEALIDVRTVVVGQLSQVL